MSGATYHMDVELGHAFRQLPVSGGGKTVSAGAAITR